MGTRSLRTVLVALSLLVPARALAFVPPSWSAQHLDRRNAMLGKWEVVSVRFKSAAPVDAPHVVVEIDPTRITFEDRGAGELTQARWRVVDEDGDMLGIEVDSSEDRTKKVDVLIEGGDALTFYVTDEDGDDDAVLRLVRAP